MSDPARASRLSRPRLILFSVLTTASVLLVANEAVEWLERRGVVETLRPGDFVQHVDDAIFQRESRSHWEKTPYARRTMVRGGFHDDPRPDRRMFIVGGSFAMGGPYADPLSGEERPGTPATWLRGHFAQSHPDLRVEVVNTGAMGQDSHRVRRVSELLLEHDPSALVVASCNNEAWMPEGEVQEALRGLGGYRLLDRLLRPEPDAARPRIHTPSDNEDALKTAFEENLRSIARMAGERDVPVFLSTVPINLRYSGLEREASWSGANLENADCLQRGISLAEQGDDEGAAGILETCSEASEAQFWLGLIELRTRGETERRPRLVEELGACIVAGLEHYFSARYAKALEQFARCDNVHEAMRWIGLTKLAMQDVDGARRALEGSVDLFPRNRCRPEFNEVVRQIAMDTDGVHLVELDGAVRDASPNGLPGNDLFVDVCHMNERGYGIVGRTMWKALVASDLFGDPRGAPSLESVAESLGLGSKLRRRDPLEPETSGPWQ